ncbi:MAG: PAS domain-containing protein [Alphaproteobacteria bacterium]|nr:PAS domain-containing protein [Alphaproteobacteria bacterium]
MKLHKLLLRQLNRMSIGYNIPPSDLPLWQKFIDRINKSYLEADQERYTLERSMNISSHELLNLNKRLEIAQHIARLGYWEIDLSNKIVFWSRELYLLYGLDTAKPPPNYGELIRMIHSADRSHMEELLNKAHTKGGDYQTELKIESAEGKYRWFHVTFQYNLKTNNNIIRGTSSDITDRKEREKEIESLHQQIIQSARYTGMADIAASTLHNVGNVLNSANVSVELLKEYMNQSDIKKIDNIENLLEKNLPHLPEYFRDDPQGQFIPKYLIALLQNIKKDYSLVTQEVENLGRNISHISDIIMTQNDISRASGLTEKVFLPDIIEAALGISTISFAQDNIHIEKKYQETPFVLVDKVKLLQVLINLIRNARDSLVENLKVDQKILTITLEQNKLTNDIIILFRDNGMGILPENLPKIFSLGFTTKEKGHGLGLHMSIINANDLGGSLSVESEGNGKGATFILTFPLIEPPSILQ